MSGGPSGILRVDKPVGPTSHDVVARARRALGTRRVGHTGTLDPFASGLLLLLVGNATRLSEVLTGLPKSYEAEARLGERTDTDDREGVVVESRGGWEALDEASIGTVLRTFLGPQSQVPPAFSAKKVGGEAMHRRARRGEIVELPAVPVEVLGLELQEWSPPLLRFRVECSSGTYIRALARDIGEVLGVGAHLTQLRRTRVGEHRVVDAVPAGALDDPARVARAWLAPREALRHLPAIDVTVEEAARLRLGQSLPAPVDAPPSGRVALFRGESLVALAEPGAGRLHPRRVFPE